MDIKNYINIDLFCNVVDNYGDIGVCFRLARELTNKHETIVNLYVNDLETFHKICKEIDPTLKNQVLYKNLIVHKWIDNDPTYTPSDVVIEAFGCNIHEEYINKLTPKNIWINLEYLSAESWTADFHKQRSLQKNNLRKYFFLPGFTDKTGGLNYEENFINITAQEAREFILEKFKINDDFKTAFISLVFCYENEKLVPLLQSIRNQHKKVIFLLPDSISTTFLEENGLLYKISNFHKSIWIKFKMIDQEEFNYILKGVDFNIVRGEDTITQAIMTGKPFIWQIYKQDENAHVDKLKAFLSIYTQNTDDEDLKEIIFDAFLEFNECTEKKQIINLQFENYMIEYAKLYELSSKFRDSLIANNSLANNLLNFIKEK